MAGTGFDLLVISPRRLTTLEVLRIFQRTNDSTCRMSFGGVKARYRLKKFAPFLRFGLLRRGVGLRGSRRSGLLRQVLASQHLGHSQGTF